MEPVALYKTFSQDFFYSFHKHSTDLELEELGTKYTRWLDKHGPLINGILTGKQSPDELRHDARGDLEFLARMEAKFPRQLPLNIRGEYFESETGFAALEGQLHLLMEGRSHLVRLIKPAEYDKNYWFYAASDSPPQHVFCLEFGLDMIEYLKGVKTTNKAKLTNLRRALAYRKREVYQFWTLAPYVHHGLMKLGYPWNLNVMTLLKIAGRRFAQTRQPFAGVARFQLGYDEKMPTHLLARIEAMRDVGAVKRGEYTTRYGIELPDRLRS
jgi:hypothetical protein